MTKADAVRVARNKKARRYRNAIKTYEIWSEGSPASHENYGGSFYIGTYWGKNLRQAVKKMVELDPKAKYYVNLRDLTYAGSKMYASSAFVHGTR